MKSKVFSPHEQRLSALQKRFKDLQVDGCIIEHPLNLFYLTGLKLSTGILLISRKSYRLFVDGRYIEKAKAARSVLVELLTEEAQQKWLMSSSLRILAFDAHYTSYERYQFWKKFVRKLSIRLLAIDHLLKESRSIKSEEELRKMQKSAQLLWVGYQYALKRLKRGVTEKEVALEFEIFSRREGAEALAFEPIIAFGKNSAYPHHRAGSTTLKSGDLVLMDLGLVMGGYHSDMTRVHFFGKEDAKLKKVYRIVRQAQAAALKLCKPGTLVKQLDLAARREMARENMESYFTHSLGHGIGLETHEFPRLHKTGIDKDVVLEEGMVITIEPGLYLPEKGGVRYEDTIVITKEGYQNFFP